MTSQADRKSERVEVAVSQEIDRPIADVFNWYADDHVQNHPRWDPDLELEQATDGPIGVGSVIRRRNTRYEAPVEETMEVVEFEREKSMRVVIEGPSYEMPGGATFEELGPARTKITISAEVPASIDADLVRSKMERSVRTIEELIESDI